MVIPHIEYRTPRSVVKSIFDEISLKVGGTPRLTVEQSTQDFNTLASQKGLLGLTQGLKGSEAARRINALVDVLNRESVE